MLHVQKLTEKCHFRKKIDILYFQKTYPFTSHGAVILSMPVEAKPKHASWF